MAKKKRVKRNYGRLIKTIVLVAAIAIAAVLVNRNWTRIQLWAKGYDFAEQGAILNRDPDEIQDYLNCDHMIDIKYWDEEYNRQHYYDYDYFQSISKLPRDKIINYIDALYTLMPALNDLGYTKKFCRDKLLEWDITNFESLIDNSLEYESVKPYFEINGAIFEDLSDYVASGLQPLEAVLSITYPFVFGQAEVTRTFVVKDPTALTTVGRKGLLINAGFEPDDLVEPKVTFSPGTTNTKMRKEAAKAMEKMVADAAAAGLTIWVGRAYISYAEQSAAYADIYSYWPEPYASSMILTPGTDEHQLGLGADLTCPSVQDAYAAWEATAEYAWLQENAYKYGYIFRYPASRRDQTGDSLDYIFYRYVGLDAAKEIHEYGPEGTLEDYIYRHGFATDIDLVG